MRFRNVLLGLAVASLFLFGLDRAGLLAAPRFFLGSFTNPLQVGWVRVNQAVTDQLAVLGQIGSLAKDNLNLRAENDQYKADNVQLKLLKKENEALRQELGVSEERHFRVEAAQVLGSVPSLGARQLLLDQGSSAGIKIGEVVTSGSVALGVITLVEAEKSTVELLTDPSAQVLAETNRGAKGILVGQFQSSAKLTKLLQDDPVDVGDSVVTSGGDVWPKNLVIGTVSKVTSQAGALFQEAEVAPALDVNHLSIVFIVVGGQ